MQQWDSNPQFPLQDGRFKVCCVFQFHHAGFVAKKIAPILPRERGCSSFLKELLAKEKAANADKPKRGPKPVCKS
jgi:hypothetical protein